MQHKRIMVSVPVGMLQEVDGLSELENRQRSELICDAMRCYLEERKRRDLRERLRRGYQEMARINLELAEESLGSDADLVLAAGEIGGTKR